MKINDREFTETEFGEIIQLACDVCGYLRDRVKKPMDLLIVLSVAAVITGRALTQGAGGEHRMSDVMMWLTLDVENKCTAVLAPDDMAPFAPRMIKPAVA